MKVRTRFHVAEIVDGDTVPVVNKNTGEVIYKYSEKTAIDYFFNISNTAKGEFVLVQTEEVVPSKNSNDKSQPKLDFYN